MFERAWRLLCLFLVLAVGFLSVSVGAAEPFDPERIGSVQIRMQYQEQPVPGGSFTLYSVATMSEADGALRMQLTAAYANSGVSLEKIDDPTLAKALASYADEQKLSGLTQDVTAAGSVRFEGLLPGVYLLVQKTAADGFEEVEPFLVRVPFWEDGEYHYDLVASPKMTETRDPISSEPSSDGSTSTDSSLPQTGQLNWPIPILALSGLVLLSCGWMLYFGKKRSNEKK